METKNTIDGNHAKRKKLFNLFLIALLVVFAFASPIYSWQQSSGDLFSYFYLETPPGQLFYIFSKLAGLYAIQLVWLQIMLTLIARHYANTVIRYLHPWLGTLSLIAVLCHVVLFVSAVSLRTGHFPFDLLLPRFSAGFYNTALSLGLIGLGLLVIVALSGILRRTTSTAAQWLHRCAYLTVGLAFIHGLLIGSETRFGITPFLYTCQAVGLLFAIGYSNGRQWVLNLINLRNKFIAIALHHYFSARQ